MPRGAARQGDVETRRRVRPPGLSRGSEPEHRWSYPGGGCWAYAASGSPSRLTDTTDSGSLCGQEPQKSNRIAFRISFYLSAISSPTALSQQPAWDGTGCARLVLDRE